jgi:hypothetical protein
VGCELVLIAVRREEETAGWVRWYLGLACGAWVLVTAGSWCSLLLFIAPVVFSAWLNLLN